MLRLFEIFVSLFRWHACKLGKLNARIAKRMTTCSFSRDIAYGGGALFVHWKSRT